MKWLLIIISARIQFIIAPILVLPVLSCSKENLPECERWEITDESHPNGCIDLGCGGSRTLQLDFCGDGLKDAKAGNTIILNEDQCCKRTRTFNRFIRKV